MTFAKSRTLRHLGTAAAIAMTAVPAQAALVSYSVAVSIDSGPLAGQSYTGNFSFDDAQSPGSIDDFSTYVVSSLSFTFDGVTYTHLDVEAGTELLWSVPASGLAGLEGVFSTFAFLPDIGFGPYFVYEEGSGDADYTPRNGGTVPEPASVALVGLALLGMAGARRPPRLTFPANARSVVADRVPA